MLPRRSAVMRYALFIGVVVAIFLWITRSSEDTAAMFTSFSGEDLSKSTNGTKLVQMLTELHLELGGDDAPPVPINLTIPELREHVIQLLQRRPKNPHPFRYVINPTSACSGEVFLLVYVHSAPSHFKQRMAIRETWGSPRNFADIVIKAVFLCGITSGKDSNATQDALSLEADTYGDIVQENFIDSYRNLTYKGIMGLKWVSKYCSHARFLLKSDDDIFINIFSLVKHLQTMSQRPAPVRKLLLCLVWYHMKVMRDTRSKWYLSPTEYPDDFFPTYCSGSAFVLTPDIAGPMFEASFRIPFFWVDDFYVTGLLAREAGVTHENFNSVYMLSPSAFLQKFTEPNVSLTLVVGHVHKINYMKIVWNKVLNEQRSRNGTGVAATVKKS